VYVDGNLTSDSTGDRYTESSTRSMHRSGGSGFDDRTLVTGGPTVNHLGVTTGSDITTTTLDHTANEVNFNDNRTRDRSDWRFDVGTGNLVPIQRVRVNSHTNDVSLDLIRNTTGDRVFIGSYTLNYLDYEFDGEAQSQFREAIASGQNGSATVTRTTPFEGAGAGVTIVSITGTDAVAYSSYDTLIILSSSSNEEINGGGGYFFFQSSNGDETWRSFDSSRSTQRIDGTGDVRYWGNRSMNGTGTSIDWYELTPNGFGFDVTYGNHLMPMM